MQQLSFLAPVAAPVKLTGKKRRIAQVYDSDASDCADYSSLESYESDEMGSYSSSPCPSPVYITKKFKSSPSDFGTAFSSTPASFLYNTHNPFYFTPLLSNATLLNPADYMNVAPNGLNLSGNIFVASFPFNFPVPHELILRPNININIDPNDNPYSASLDDSCDYEDIISEMFN